MRYVIVLFVCFAVTIPVLAQESDHPLCQPEAMKSILEEMVPQMNASSQEAWLSNLIDLRTSLVMLEEACLGLGYSSNEEGLQPVIGPVPIPSGVYRATFTTTGFGIVDVEAVSGTCETGFGSLFNVSQGQADDGAQNTLTASDSCMALIQVSNTREPWTLEFETLVRTEE